MEFKNLPNQFEGLKIVQISDLHGKEFGDALSNKVNVLKPDLIVVTGDVIDRPHPDYQYIKRTLEPLQAKLGKFYVAGNNEHVRALSMEKVEAAVYAAGFENLKNARKQIKLGNSHLWLVGVDDPNTGHDDLEEALEGTDAAQKILLAHSPEIVYKAAQQNIDLVLVGHTHGGQVRIPGLTQRPELKQQVNNFIERVNHKMEKFQAFILSRQADQIVPEPLPEVGSVFTYNMATGFEQFIAGLYKVDSTQMYVNRGLGETRMSFRLFSPPEITLITLTGKY